MQEDGILAEDLIGYGTIFFIKPSAKREHTRGGCERWHPFPERTGQCDSETAVYCL